MDTIKKITGLFVFVLIIGGIIYLSFFTKNEFVQLKFSVIELTGNNLLSEAEYLEFTRLNDVSAYEQLTLAILKDRFEKHPYVMRADIKINSKKKAIINITEKTIIAFLISDNKQFFITDKYQVLPLFINTRFVDFPIISNPVVHNVIKPLSFIKEADTFEAFKIIEAAKNIDAELFRSISEINLRYGGDIIITVSDLNTPVIFGSNEPAKKVSYLHSFWNEIVKKNLINEKYEYIDLRFDRHIYLGKEEATGI